MAIRVALHHKTEYHYDRRVRLSPDVVRLRPAPHTRTNDFLVKLDQRLDIRYTIRMESGIQICAETLGTSLGSCRDSACAYEAEAPRRCLVYHFSYLYWHLAELKYIELNGVICISPSLQTMKNDLLCGHHAR